LVTWNFDVDIRVKIVIPRAPLLLCLCLPPPCALCIRVLTAVW